MSPTRRRTTYTNGSTYALQTEEAGKRLVPKAPGDGTHGCPRSRGGSRAQRIAPLRQRAEAARPSALPAIADLTETAFVRQDRSDTHQTQLDDNQRAQDLRRNMLDKQQIPLDEPPNPNAIRDALPAAAAERDQSLRLQAVAALARAEQRYRRAQEALHCVQAYECRKEGCA
jgi:hypothetical protein